MIPKTTATERKTARLVGCCHAANRKSRHVTSHRRQPHGLRVGECLLSLDISGSLREQADDFFDAPNVVCNASFYRRRHTNGLMPRPKGYVQIEEWLVTRGALHHEETGRAALARRAALRPPDRAPPARSAPHLRF
jgi:hypothetical protein